MSLDALVVLGCRMLPDGVLSAAAERRAQAAAEAYRQGRAPLVVASGGRRWYGIAEAEVLVTQLAKRGLPEAALLPELRSLSTCENARNAAALLAERGALRVGVVTCDWHMPRALKSFRAAGLTPVAIPAPSPSLPPSKRLRRALSERARYFADHFATWGWSRP